MPERVLAALAVGCLLVGACGSTHLPTTTNGTSSASPAQPSRSPEVATAQPIQGGCGGTQVFAGPAPNADQSLAANPWAAASPPESGIIAYFWGDAPYLAAGNVRPGGAANKILWASNTGPAGDLVVTAHPLGASSPIVRFRFPGVRSWPSLVDLPTAGCWHLDLAAGSSRATIDLLVANPGSTDSPG